MITDQFISGLVSGLLVCLVVEYLWERHKTKARQSPDDPHPEPAPPPKNPASQWQWYPMPCGTRLELGSTGFYVLLKTNGAGENGFTYHAYSPEHYRMARSGDLAAVKRYLEGEARERAEFEPVARGWRS